MKLGIIYMYTSPSNKKYIGQTTNEKLRKSQHKQRTKKTDTKFGRAILKYGFENFKYEVIFKIHSLDIKTIKEMLDKMEVYFIEKYNTRSNGYNTTKGGDGVLGLKHTEETKKYIGECSRKFFEDHSEAKEKIREAHIGKTASEETREKISNKLKVSENTIKNKKKVYQYDNDKNLIATFNSISEAAHTIETSATHKTKSNRISEVCNNKEMRKSAFGFIWSFEEF